MRCCCAFVPVILLHVPPSFVTCFSVLHAVARLSVLSATFGLCAAKMDVDQSRVLPTPSPRPPAAPAVPLDDLLGAIRTEVQAEVSAVLGRLAAPPTTASAFLAPTTSTGNMMLT